jgi:hypothetical protein
MEPQKHSKQQTNKLLLRVAMAMVAGPGGMQAGCRGGWGRGVQWRRQQSKREQQTKPWDRSYANGVFNCPLHPPSPPLPSPAPTHQLSVKPTPHPKQTYLPTSLSTYKAMHILTYLPTSLSTYKAMHIPTYVPLYLPTNQCTYLPTYLSL